MAQQPVTIGFRPTFSLESSRHPAELAGELAASFGHRAKAAGPHLLLAIATEQRRPWSPWLHIDIHPPQGNEHGQTLTGSVLTCRFSPHPSVWTATMLTSLALLTTAQFAVFFAISQHIVGATPWAWWVAAAAIALVVGLWIGAQIAQRMAAPQMHELMSEVHALLDRAP